MLRATTKPGWRIDATAAAAFAPAILLPALVIAVSPLLADWQVMWLVAISIYAGLKLMTLATCPAVGRAPIGRDAAYLLLWPGMNARAFLAADAPVAKPRPSEWLLAILKPAVGIALLFAVVPRAIGRSDLAAGWIGLVGLVFVLHFGLFHILSLVWRERGIDAPPIMNSPLLAKSLADFWSRRWNRAFRDLAYGYVMRPLAGRFGAAGATMIVFAVSGLVHELVISVPVHGGYGGPTCYFLLQGAGLMIEKSRLGRRLGLGRGLRGRLFGAAIVVAPVGWLFHPAFIRGAILPTLHAIGAI